MSENMQGGGSGGPGFAYPCYRNTINVLVFINTKMEIAAFVLQWPFRITLSCFASVRDIFFVDCILCLFVSVLCLFVVGFPSLPTGVFRFSAPPCHPVDPLL